MNGMKYSRALRGCYRIASTRIYLSTRSLCCSPFYIYLLVLKKHRNNNTRPAEPNAIVPFTQLQFRFAVRACWCFMLFKEEITTVRSLHSLSLKLRFTQAPLSHPSGDKYVKNLCRPYVYRRDVNTQAYQTTVGNVKLWLTTRWSVH